MKKDQISWASVNNRSSTSSWIILLIVMLAAMNIRSGLVGFAPVLPLVKEELALNYSMTGLAQAIPVIFMGTFSGVGGYLVSLWGSKSLVSWGLLFICIGNAGRGLAPNAWVLLLTSAVFGIGLGLTQSAMPYMTKQLYPDRAGTATGIYTGGMLTGTLIGAALTLPVLLPLSGEWSWRGTLFVWSLLAALCLLPWMTMVPKQSSWIRPPDFRTWIKTWKTWKAWHVAIIFALQTLIFNTYTAWMPTFYYEAGIDPTGAFTFFNLVALPVTFFMPLLSDRIGKRRPMLIAASLLALAASIAHVVWYDTWFYLWSGLLGAANTTLFAIALVLAVDMSSKEEVGSLSALVLLFGYTVSAAATPLIGWIRDLSGNFAFGLLAFWVAASIMLLILSWMVPANVGKPINQSSTP